MVRIWVKLKQVKFYGNFLLCNFEKLIQTQQSFTEGCLVLVEFNEKLLKDKLKQQTFLNQF